MRDPIRREAGQYAELAWWLVPSVFAVGALAAVALSGREAKGHDAPPAQHAAVAVPQPATPAPAGAAPVPAQQPEEPAYEVTEHVQAF